MCPGFLEAKRHSPRSFEAVLRGQRCRHRLGVSRMRCGDGGPASSPGGVAEAPRVTIRRQEARAADLALGCVPRAPPRPTLWLGRVPRPVLVSPDFAGAALSVCYKPGSGADNGEEGETEEEMENPEMADLPEKLKHQLRHRELFLSRQLESLPATHIRGKCSVTLLNETESLKSYLEREDFFFYSLVYDPQQKTLLADKGEIRVGNRYQADITDLLKEGGLGAPVSLGSAVSSWRASPAPVGPRVGLGSPVVCASVSSVLEKHRTSLLSVAAAPFGDVMPDPQKLVRLS
ncbi:hypothetical protein J1605_011795 [Eschrichtius robustus]|uniref:BAH domain-containing protein n=1 Tax=Eschrichtius robustus TaxID=9764 RepID=A0AB34GLU0_ESCRO|nr:hypothetical protein J1605_011795 [Eschrichtius robustus]